MPEFLKGIAVSGGNTKTLAASLAVNGTLTIAASTTLADGSFTLTANGNVSNSGTHSGTGQVALSGGSASHSLSGTGAYQNLTLNDANGASIASGTSTVNGTLTLTNGVLTSGTGALTLGNSAAISRAAGSLSSLTPTFGTSVSLTYDDVNPTTTGSELPTSASVLSNLTINNAAGVTLNASATLKGTLTLTNGLLITGANTLTVTSAGTISGGSSGSYVYGKLDRGLTTSSTAASFPVGDSSGYRPVSLASATITHAGDLVVSTTGNNNSQGAFSSSGLSQSAFVNRDWTITAANSYAESAGSITLNFLSGDIDGGMSTSADVVGIYSGSTWTHPSVGTRTSTSITASGVTSFGDFVIGALPIPVFSGLSSETIPFGTSSVSLTGVLSANSGTVHPVKGSLVTASINGHAVNGTVSDTAGDFSVDYNDSSLAADGVAGSPYTITYAFGGDANVAAAANDTSTAMTVNKATPTVTVTVGSYTYNGSPQGPNSATTSPASTGVVTYSYVGTGSSSYGPSPVAPTAAGSYTVTATVAADPNNNSATSSATAFAINSAAPAFSGLTSVTNSYGITNIILSGQVSAAGPVYPANGDPVSVTINGYTVSGTVTNATGDFSIDYNDPSLATNDVSGSPYTITYQYPGNAAAGLSSATDATTWLTITQATPTVTVTVGTYAYNGLPQGPGSVMTSPVSTGDVTYSYAGTGSTIYGPSAMPPTVAGSYTVTATVAADANNTGASSDAAAFSINQASAFVGASSSENPSGYLDSVAFMAALPADASGDVVFASTNGVIGTSVVSSGSASSLSITNLPRGTNLITAAYSGDANYLGSTGTVYQVVTNHPPVAVDMTCYRAKGSSLNLAIADLLTNVTDVDGDTITLQGLGASGTGASISNDNTSIYYVPGTGAASNSNDSFTYTVSDGFGGSATANILVDVYSAPGPAQISAPAGGVVNITFFGIPTSTYVVETTTNLSGPWWALSTNSAGSDGSWQFSDPNATNAQQYYRCVQP
jgi:hypothetical protein